MELGILILMILGSFIFKKSKSTEENQGKPVPSKDMTWEEMEEYYGITLSRESKETEKMASDLNRKENVESVVGTYDPMDVEFNGAPTHTDIYDEPVTRAYRTAYERAEESRKAQYREEAQNVVPTHHSSVRKESLRAAARHGMVWSMILEAPKGARMVQRYHR